MSSETSSPNNGSDLDSQSQSTFLTSSQPLSNVIDLDQETSTAATNAAIELFDIISVESPDQTLSETTGHHDYLRGIECISVPTTPDSPSPRKIARIDVADVAGVVLTYDTPVREASQSQRVYRTTPLPVEAIGIGSAHDKIGSSKVAFLSAALEEVALEDVVDNADESVLPTGPLLPAWGGTSGEKFCAAQVFEVDDMPMYPVAPKSSAQDIGSLYVINLTRMSKSERENLHTCIMYSHLETGSSNETQVSYNNAGRMRSRTFTCRGVKLCTGLHPGVKHSHLGGASAEILLQRNAALSKEFAGAMPREVPEDFIFGPATVRLDNRQRTYIHAQHIEARVLAKKFCTHTASNGSPCLGSPVVHHVRDVRTHAQVDDFGREVPAMTWILGCSQWRANLVENTHYIMWNLEQFLDVIVFKDLIRQITRNGSLSTKPVFFCSAIHHYSSRKTNCKQLHGTSKCKIMPSAKLLGLCPVRFTLLTPITKTIDSEKAYLYVTGGHHNHAPSPPDRTPRALWQSIRNVLQRLGPNVLLDQKPLAITEHPEITKVLEGNKAESLEDLHPSLKPEVVATLIYRQRMLSAPDGRAFAGACSQQRREQLGPSEERYVRCTHIENNCSFVICFTNGGASILYSMEYIEVDLAFKRVKGAFNEMEIVTFAENPPRTITHARIFMDKETTSAYQIAFRLLFDTIARELDRPNLTFRHLHPQSNLQALVSDFDTKQAAGMGLYLQSIDPQNRSWNWHISRIVRYCKVHFKRGIDMKYPRPHPANLCMNRLLRCPTVAAYYELLTTIERNWPDTRGWCQHKRRPDIAAGLIPDASGIDEFVWQRIPSHTNAGESAHNASNQSGTRLSLMHAIDNSRKMDRRQDLLRSNYIKFGSQPTQRQKTLTTHLSNAQYQHRRRLTKQSETVGSINESEANQKVQSNTQQEDVVLMNPALVMSHPVGISSSGSPKKRANKTGSRGRPKGSRNRIIRPVAKPQFVFDTDSQGSGHHHSVASAKPTTGTEVDIYSELFISKIDEDILHDLPADIVDLYHRQCSLILEEESTRVITDANDSHISSIRIRFPNKTIAELQVHVREGGSRLNLFKMIWTKGIEARQALLNRCNGK